MPVNAILAGAGFIIGSVLVTNMWRMGEVMAGKRFSEDTEAERERLISEE
jgi:hypothetical protein